MVDFTNQLLLELGDKVRCHEVIISGGIQSFLDGYYLTEKLNMSAVYGQASSFLKHAQGDYKVLHDYIQAQVDGLACAKAFLKVR
jgi:isopentenyl-diphosphate delta-isomerase